MAVFRPTPGSGRSCSIDRGTSPPWSATSAWAMPIRLFVLFRKNPVGPDDVLDFTGGSRGQRLRRREPGEERGSDEIDPHVGTLRREDRGAQQLERIAEVERALRVGVGPRESLEDQPLPCSARRAVRTPAQPDRLRRAPAQEPVQRLRIEDVAGAEPSLPGDADAVIDIGHPAALWASAPIETPTP